MKSIALLAQKGGAGKTTLAIHLAVLAEQEGEQSVLIDCDPQKSTADWWRARSADRPMLVEAQTSKLAEILRAAEADKTTVTIIDTAPHAERAAIDVAKAVDLVLIPCRPSILDLRAIGATVEIVNSTGARAAVVLNHCPPRRGDIEVSITREAREGLASYGLPVAPVSITQRSALAHALIDGRSVTEFDPGGKAAAEIRALWKWIKEKL